ncbi:hypothetical protein GCK72_017129 [Caenorhabditis remanei]|uniref:N-terminal Ras-GEF domain-containing protein n=1 Tax=Caenorhabditis remanei TaxID=31234 RepID=A0A6A5G699_CAERE|nr:hypothetical protein GCK72_017129 [Caenorhabditis remanei]KAF1750578.1 hypothetical protein GCK72_017129 [Caenorhabditis remanei]
MEEEPQQELLTEDQLVARCVECFDIDADDEVDDIQFADALFLSHQWLSDSLSLITHFVNYYQETRDIEHREAVCRAVAFWIEKFPMHFDAQPQVCAQVVRLKTIAEDVNESIRNGLDVSSLPSFAWLRAVSVRNPLAKQTAFSLSFVQASASDISTSLSHIDYRVLSRISITELKQYVKDGHLKSCPMLERSISVFNDLPNYSTRSTYITSDYCNSRDPGSRLDYSNPLGSKNIHRILKTTVVYGSSHWCLATVTSGILDPGCRLQYSLGSETSGIQQNYSNPTD